MVVLRPAEISIIIMTFAEYSVQPFSSLIGLDDLSSENQQNVIKLLSILSLGKVVTI